jgi:amino acid adenylation domain-containing protein
MQSEFAKQDEYLHVGLQQVQQMLGQQNLFDSPFVYANYPVDSRALQFASQIEITNVKGHSATHYGLALSVMHSPDDLNLILKVIYDQSLFEVRHVSRIVARLIQMLQMLTTEHVDELCLGELRWSTDQERHQVLELFNQSGTSNAAVVPDNQTTAPSSLPDLFEQQVAGTPDALALVCGDERLSYRELDERANRLARHLLSKGIHADQIVAILMDRSTEMLVSLLAVLKVGAAYLPMDPTYPVARLAFMLADSQAILVISTTSILDETNILGELDTQLQERSATQRLALVNTVDTLCLDDYIIELMLDQYPSNAITQTERVQPLMAQHLAYLIYTSGSTGRPKGAGNTHQGTCNLVHALIKGHSVDVNSRVMQFASIAFDASFSEIMPALSTGATLYLIPDSATRIDPLLLGRFISDNQITLATIPPVVLPEIPMTSLSSLRTIVVAGEACSPALVKRHAGHCHLLNGYGPTEAAVCATIAGPLDVNIAPNGIVPIGQPIMNTRIYILDAGLNPLPVGVIGELYIEGIGLARGYLGRSGLTAERFIANPFAQDGTTGSRIYRSGDLARWTEDGILEYLGRADAQVKIRGFRIELGEIEAAILAIPGVTQCTVQAQGEESAKQLVAYLVTAASPTIPEPSEIGNLLANRLPDYMIPVAFILLDRLPLTPNGKLDTRALPAPEISGDREHHAPVTEHEKLIATLFTELTGATRVGLDDSFFALGGHSLLAMRLISQIRARTGLELALRVLFDQPSVRGLAKELTALQSFTQTNSLKVSRPPIVADLGVLNRDGAGDERALSFGQIRLWTLNQIEDATGAYNIPAALKISGELRVDALELALIDVIKRHEPLRTVIRSNDGHPQGFVLTVDEGSKLLTRDDLSTLPLEARTKTLNQTIKTDAITPFDLSRDLMVRVRLIKLQDQEHILTLVLHHIAGDGVSRGIFCQDLAQAYEARTRHQVPNWKRLAVSYADHAVWQRAWLEESGELAEQSQSWRQQLAGIPELLSLPTDYPRDAARSRIASYLPIEISASTAADLQALANKHQTTLFSVLVALYGALLGRMANQTDVVIGAPVAGRTIDEIDEHIGFFVNTLALRVEINGSQDINTLIERVKDSVNHALTHQDLPFERLVEDLGVTRSLSHTPVFQAMLAWQTQDSTELTLDGLAIESISVGLDQTKFDLTLSISPSPDGAIRGVIEFDTSLFDESRIKQWNGWLVRMLDQALALSLTDKPVNTITLMSETESDRVLALSQGKEASTASLSRLAQSSVLPTCFEQQVLLTPEATALIYETGSVVHSVSYLTLNKRINQLARLLVAKGVRRGQTVAILMNRSPEMIISIMATLKTGAAYLPLDLSYPLERLSYMLTDSQASAVLCTTELATTVLSDVPSYHAIAIVINDLATQAEIQTYSENNLSIDGLAPELVFNDLAYIMYTSGSTGRPKGVSFLHGSLMNLVHWQQIELPEGGRRVLQYSPIGFDASAQEIAATLTRGATTVLVDEDTRKDSRALLAFIEKHQIDDLYAPFVVLNNLALAKSNFEMSGWPKSIFTAGEQLQINPELRQAFNDHPDSRLYNFYGPTEAHVVSYYSLASQTHTWELLPPIGWPIWNTQLFILDSTLNMTPEGSIGELYIAGNGLARGYFNRPALTAERFIACPFIEHPLSCRESRMYRTGDLARRRSDGSIEFMGRADEQVKIRGYRIELGEIEENILATFSQIAQVAVIVKDISNDRRLVAYLVAHVDATVPEISELKAVLSKTLPEYMMPAAFVVIESLPLTPHGKLNSRALPTPEITGEGTYRAPVSEQEKIVAALFTELTGAVRVGLDDSFFALGGHSLLAIRLLAQLRVQTGMEIALRAVFEQPTVLGLAKALSEAQTLVSQGAKQPSRPRIVPGRGVL